MPPHIDKDADVSGGAVVELQNANVACGKGARNFKS
jgi:hypothetical protein